MHGSRRGVIGKKKGFSIEGGVTLAVPTPLYALLSGFLLS